MKGDLKTVTRSSAGRWAESAYVTYANHDACQDYCITGVREAG